MHQLTFFLIYPEWMHRIWNEILQRWQSFIGYLIAPIIVWQSLFYPTFYIFEIQINIIALSFIRYIHHTYCIHLNMKLHVNVKCIYKNCVDSWFSCWVFIFRRTLLQTFASCHKFISCENWALRIVNFVNPAEMLKTLSGNFRIWDMDSSYFCTQFWYSIQQNFYNVI